MYECRCGHTFTVEKEVEHEGESMFVCPLCQNNDYWRLGRPVKVRTNTEKMIRCQMLYGVEMDYLNSGRIPNTDIMKLTIRNMNRYTNLSRYYLQQIKDK